MGEAGVQLVKLLRLPLIFSLLAPLLRADTPTSLGRQLPGSNGSRIKPDFFFFFFFLEIGIGVFLYVPPPPPTLPPPPFFFFFFLRHGPGSGSWKRNKCGKRERKPELNDRMQAT